MAPSIARRPHREEWRCDPGSPQNEIGVHGKQVNTSPVKGRVRDQADHSGTDSRDSTHSLLVAVLALRFFVKQR